MNAPLTVSAELAASVQRLKARTWRYADAQAFEQGSAPTQPASAPRLPMASVAPKLKASLSKYTPRRCRVRLTGEERGARRARKRMLGGSSTMPDTMRHIYTEGERAVACVVAGEVKRHGQCELSIDAIAERAGVGRTTVQNFMHEGRRQGHLQIVRRPRPGANHDTNVVRIMSAEWRSWIKRAPNAALVENDRVQETKNVNINKSISIDDADAAVGNTPNLEAPSPRADRMAFQMAKIAGLDPRRLPASWVRWDPERVVERWIKDFEALGLNPETLPGCARHVMERKPEKTPPNSVRYFEPTIDRIINECRTLRSQLRKGARRHASR
jgi:hypothetical protein